MSDASYLFETLHEEEVSFKDAISERVFDKIAGVINQLIDQSDRVAVGEYKVSLLSLSEFQVIRGTTWVLANGQNVAGSAFHTLTGQTNVPDLTGAFMRMRSYGTGVDPAGDQATGTWERATYTGHTHPVTFTWSPDTALENAAGSTGALDRGFAVQTFAAEAVAAQNVAPSIASSGGNEFRPNNITVNVFIKIN